MKNSEISGLYSEKLLDMAAGFVRNNRYTILGSLLAGFLAYMFMITNKYPNHDELVAMFTAGATVESGRWGLEILSKLFPDMSMPWIHGIVSMTLLTLGSCLIVHIFQIRTRILQMLLGGLIVAFPAQICTFTFMYTASAYAIAFLLAVAAVYFMTRERIWHRIAGAACLVGSLSIYQAYLAIVVSLLILYYFFALLCGQMDTKGALIRGLGAILLLLASLVIYWLISQAVWRVTGVGMGQYAGSALALDIGSIPGQIKAAYTSFFRTLLFRENGIVVTRLARVAHPILLALTLCMTLLWGIRSKKWGALLLMLLLLALLPLGIGCMYLLFSGESIHTLVLYSYIALYVLFAGVVECSLTAGSRSGLAEKWIRLSSDGMILLMAAVLAGNIYIANKAYLSMHMSYENTYFYTTAILTRLQDTPGYTTDSKVAIIGEYTEPYYHDVFFSDLEQLIGVRKLSPNAYSIGGFFEYYNGIPLRLASREEIESVAGTEAFHEMACYPNDGYMEMIDGMIVIKLSELP